MTVFDAGSSPSQANRFNVVDLFRLVSIICFVCNLASRFYSDIIVSNRSVGSVGSVGSLSMSNTNISSSGSSTIIIIAAIICVFFSIAGFALWLRNRIRMKRVHSALHPASSTCNTVSVSVSEYLRFPSNPS
jgi:hypothetical protein